MTRGVTGQAPTTERILPPHPCIHLTTTPYPSTRPVSVPRATPDGPLERPQLPPHRGCPEALPAIVRHIPGSCTRTWTRWRQGRHTDPATRRPRATFVARFTSQPTMTASDTTSSESVARGGHHPEARTVVRDVLQHPDTRRTGCGLVAGGGLSPCSGASARALRPRHGAPAAAGEACRLCAFHGRRRPPVSYPLAPERPSPPSTRPRDHTRPASHRALYWAHIDRVRLLGLPFRAGCKLRPSAQCSTLTHTGSSAL